MASSMPLELPVTSAALPLSLMVVPLRGSYGAGVELGEVISPWMLPVSF